MFKRFLKDILKPEASLNDKPQREVPELSSETKELFSKIRGMSSEELDKPIKKAGLKR